MIIRRRELLKTGKKVNIEAANLTGKQIRKMCSEILNEVETEYKQRSYTKQTMNKEMAWYEQIGTILCAVVSVHAA